MKTIKKEIIQENSSLNFLCDMKKVICIKKDGWRSITFNKPTNGPKFGEECTVIDVSDSGFYVLLGYEISVNGAKRATYNPIHFIDTSEIDETTFERNYEKEKV